MPSIIVTSLYRSEPARPTHPKFGGEYYQHQYEKIRLAWEDLGIRFVRSPLSTFRGGKFSGGWEFARGVWRRIAPYRPQIIWDKSHFSYETFPLKEKLAEQFFFLCHPKFSEIAHDKFLTAKMFSDISPRTVYVRSRRELSRAAALLRSSRIVVKPNTLSGGRGIAIVPRQELSPALVRWPSILQEFIETSGGVPGIAEGRHDLRVELLNDRVFRSYVRVARKGKLLANLHQGGTGVWISKNRIPKSALEIIRSMQPKLQSLYPLYYTVDFLFDASGRPWIAEINHTPGVDFPTVGFHGNEADVWKQFGRFLLKEYTVWKKL